MRRLRTPPPAWARRSSKNRSSALVIVLFMVAILSIIIVAFMVTSNLDRESSQSYSQGVNADQLGLGGLSQVVTDLQQEISANSSASGTASGYTNYTPNFATNAQPELSLAGNTAVSAPNLVTNLVMNLVKISSHSAPPYAKGPILATSVNSTTNPSLNGRYISTNRWNKPAMIANNWPSSLQTPDWIDVSRAGVSPQSLTIAQARDASFGNTNYVVGRYAYAVYDEGGMLDVTVAGYTTSATAGMTATLIGRKGNLALADLTQITNGVSANLTQAQVEALVAFRNGYSTNNYANYITNIAPTNGFLYVQGNGAQSDNTFVSRQDLINYATANNLTGALPYLCTFTREKNRPSWYPTQDATAMTDASGTIHGNGVYPYATLRESSAATNSDIPNVRVAAPFPRADGSTSVVGEPLVKRRFPLSRLALLSETSPSAADTTLIQQYFGLVPDALSTSAAPIWDYDNPKGSSPASSILRLAQVAALTGSNAREPDFFELLKAAILSGSLGLNPGAPIPSGGHPGVFGDVVGITSSSDAQIMQIGTNIIDQFRTGNYPIDIYTSIFTLSTGGLYFDTYNHFYGIKNLPFLQRVSEITTFDPPGTTSTSATGFNAWYIPEFYYPHQTATSSPGPTAFRFQAYGGESECEETQHTPTTAVIFGAPVDYGDGGPSAGTVAGRINITPPAVNNYFSMPRYASANGGCSTISAPTAASGSTSTATLNASGCITPGGGGATANDLPVGIWGGYLTITVGNTYTFNEGPEVLESFAMQYQDSSLNWHTYSTWKDTGFQQNQTAPTTVANAFLQSPLMWGRADSRTNRFAEGLVFPSSGASVGRILFGTNLYQWFQVLWSTVPAITTAFTSSMRPDHNQGAAMDSAWPTSSNFTFIPTPSTTPAVGAAEGLWADNIVSRTHALTSASGTSGINAYYSDPDGVIRPGDGAYSDANPNTTGTATVYTDGFPQVPIPSSGAADAHPIVLSRPFRSVAEMGYAYRDMPFKSLDFFTQESADAALLDVFCLDDIDMAAGKINPNTRNNIALQAVIAGSIKAENSPATTISAAASTAVANALVAHTANVANNPSNGPLINRAELVTKFSNDLTTALNSSSGLSDYSDYYNKTQRESVVRALADVSNTRTWNLMIDVVAQSGRYPPNASSLNDFVVEGERRYWLHVAIDRYTGKIIDQQLEPVHE